MVSAAAWRHSVSHLKTSALIWRKTYWLLTKQYPRNWWQKVKNSRCHFFSKSKFLARLNAWNWGSSQSQLKIKSCILVISKIYLFMPLFQSFHWLYKPFNFCLFAKMQLSNKNAFVTTAVFSSLPSHVYSYNYTQKCELGMSFSLPTTFTCCILVPFVSKLPIAFFMTTINKETYVFVTMRWLTVGSFIVTL